MLWFVGDSTMFKGQCCPVQQRQIYPRSSNSQRCKWGGRNNKAMQK